MDEEDEIKIKNLKDMNAKVNILFNENEVDLITGIEICSSVIAQAFSYIHASGISKERYIMLVQTTFQAIVNAANAANVPDPKIEDELTRVFDKLGLKR